MSKHRKDKDIILNNKQASTRRLNVRWYLLPVTVMLFILLTLWAGVWMGDVFVQVRENSFFAPSGILMQWEQSQNLGWLWIVGRAMLMLFRWPLAGSALLALILVVSCRLLGYLLRLPARWMWLEWLPIGIYTFIFTYQGYNNWHQAESGQVLGVPFAICVAITIVALVLRVLTKRPLPTFILIPKEERPLDNALQLIAGVVMIVASMVYGEQNREYVRPTAKMQTAVMHGDWDRVIAVAVDNGDMSVRPMVANYAIALVQTHKITERLFDMRIDYDPVFVRGYCSDEPNDMYDMECTYYAGLVESAYHQAMNQMVLSGPTLRTLKMLCKTAMLRGEWTVAERYLDILESVPFEDDFSSQWRCYLNRPDLLNKNPEVAVIRSLEPLHDDMEHIYHEPLYLSYNQMLKEGRSKDAVYNGMMVNLYSKTLPVFLNSLQQLRGTIPPKSIGECILLMSDRYHELLQEFPSLNPGVENLNIFYQQASPFMTDYDMMAASSRQLYPVFKGYYPYYYYFGNLKDTERLNTNNNTSNSGIN